MQAIKGYKDMAQRPLCQQNVTQLCWLVLMGIEHLEGTSRTVPIPWGNTMAPYPSVPKQLCQCSIRKRVKTRWVEPGKRQACAFP